MGFRFRPGDLKAWADLPDVNLWLYHSWTRSLHWIAEVDETKRTVRFANRCGWPVGWWEKENQRYLVENLREALDAPGEWHLDRATGRIAYLPREGEDPAAAEFTAPELTELVRVEGEPGARIEGIRFEGLSFHHAAWDLPREAMADGQAAVFLPAAVTVRHARGVTFDECEVAHTGGYGVWFDEGTEGCGLSRCEVRDLGAGGVRIGSSRSPGTGDQADPNRPLREPSRDGLLHPRRREGLSRGGAA